MLPVPVADSLTEEPDAFVTNDTVADAAPLACGVKVRVNEAVPPAGIVTGNDSPLTANSELFADAEVTVTLEPVAFMVAGKLLLAPTRTVPKLKLPGVTENWPAAVPVPDSETEGVVPDAFDTKEILPVSDPAEGGVNVTLKVKVCPAERVKGRLNPLMVNPVPVKLAWVTVTLAPPELVRTAFCVPLLPTCTLPKLTALAVSVPGVTPVPESGIVKVAVFPLLVIARLTVLLPADCGAKATLNEVLCPALSVTGKFRPVTL